MNDANKDVLVETLKSKIKALGDASRKHDFIEMGA